MPTNIVTFDKAISLLYNEKAFALDNDYVHYNLKDWLEFSAHTKDFQIVRSVSMNIALPEIIALKTFARLYHKDTGVKYSRESIIERDKSLCIYCLKKCSKEEATLEHILPLSRGGKSSFMNVAVACKTCNNKKGNKTPEEASMPLMFQPSMPRWTGGKGKLPDLESWKRYIQQVESSPAHNPIPEDS